LCFLFVLVLVWFGSSGWLSVVKTGGGQLFPKI
jgi:hypothetical protein